MGGRRPAGHHAAGRAWTRRLTLAPRLSFSTATTLRGREEGTVIQIETIETSSLGDRSYLAIDGEFTVVVDPQRDIDRVLDLVCSAGCG